MAAKQELARNNLLDFTQYTFPKYIPDKFHIHIADILTRVVRGDIKRLMIFAPPQSGKSQLVSVHLPAFWLANRPDDPVILTSYGASLAIDKSKQARAIVLSQEFEELFPEIKLRGDSHASEHWYLKGYRGSLLASGVGGPIIGHGAMLGIIDDPFESWAAAQSEAIRRSTWDWWRGTFRTRIWENGAIILIMTRWHEDDLAGRLIKDQAEDWNVVRIPAIAETQAERDENDRYLGLQTGQPDPLGREPGEPATPARFSIATMKDIKKDVGPMAWSSEYQGVPRPTEGNLIQRSWLPIVGAAPAKARRVRYWDKAASEEGDFSAGVLMAELDGVYYIEDVVRGRWTTFERQQVMLQTSLLDAMRYGEVEFMKGSADDVENSEWIIIEQYVEIWVEQEGGSGGKDSAMFDARLLAGFRIRFERPTGDKIVRGQPFRSQAEAQNVRVVFGTWNWEYINEITAMPNAAHDDQWDGTTGAFNKLAKPRFVSAYKRSK